DLLRAKTGSYPLLKRHRGSVAQTLSSHVLRLLRLQIICDAGLPCPLGEPPLHVSLLDSAVFAQTSQLRTHACPINFPTKDILDEGAKFSERCAIMEMRSEGSKNH